VVFNRIVSPRIGVVGVAGGWSTKVLLQAVEERTGARPLVELRRCRLDTVTGRVTCGDLDVSGLDALIVRKLGLRYGPHLLDRLELLSFLQRSGVRVYSDADRIGTLINRLACTLRLRSAGIAVPPTVITEQVAVAARAVESFGVAVLKPVYSTKARGMVVVRADDPALVRRLRAFSSKHRVLYVQAWRQLPGRDLGLVFVGGRHVGTYARVSGGAWNTTVRAGGHYAPHDPSPEVVALAERAQEAFGLAFTTVDVVESAAGPEVLEVSAFGGFRGLSVAVGLNLGPLLVDHVCRSLDAGRSLDS
jgi:tetrahydromethanopterin:alpha-L-glutamate ligase